MSQDTVEKLVNTLVSALLDERIHINHEVVKATNKVRCSSRHLSFPSFAQTTDFALCLCSTGCHESSSESFT